MDETKTVEIKLNGESYSIESSFTVEALLEQLANERQGNPQGKPASLGAVAVEVNAEIVPPNQFGQVQLKHGDEVEVVTLVGGG